MSELDKANTPLGQHPLDKQCIHCWHDHPTDRARKVCIYCQREEGAIRPPPAPPEPIAAKVAPVSVPEPAPLLPSPRDPEQKFKAESSVVDGFKKFKKK